MTKEILTQERLKELLHYNPDTGILRWKIPKAGQIKIGSEAGWSAKQGLTSYRLIQIDKRTYKAHRLAWLYMTGEWPKDQIDHIDRNGLNNRIKNIRDVSNRVNSLNRRPRSEWSYQRKSNDVSWCNVKMKWRIRKAIDGKRKHLGYKKGLFEAYCLLRSIELGLS